jgi:hypothetical protein
MQIIAAVFTSQSEAEAVAEKLRTQVPNERVFVLGPGTPHGQVASVPTTEDMPPVGKIICGVLGGALGLGLGICFFLPQLSAPGPDPFTIAGYLGMVFLGFTGALLGAALGRALDRASSSGLPVDELYVYEDALRKGRSVVLAGFEDEEQEARVRDSLAQSSAESVDSAHSTWWVGLRNDTQLQYRVPAARH